MRHPLAGRQLDTVVLGVEVRLIVDDVVLKPQECRIQVIQRRRGGDRLRDGPTWSVGHTDGHRSVRARRRGDVADADLIAIRPVVVHDRDAHVFHQLPLDASADFVRVRPSRTRRRVRIMACQASITLTPADLAQLSDAVKVGISPGARLRIRLERIHVQYPVDPDLQAVPAVAGLERRLAIGHRVERQSSAPDGEVLVDWTRLGEALRDDKLATRR